MKKYKPLWVSEETHKNAKKAAAEDGCTISEAIAKALGSNSIEERKKVKQYGLFR